jgi:hypothetical protein
VIDTVAALPRRECQTPDTNDDNGVHEGAWRGV